VNGGYRLVQTQTIIGSQDKSDSVSELKYRSEQITEVNLLIACNRYAQVSDASAIRPEIM
jgi:hypothetical protein